MDRNGVPTAMERESKPEINDVHIATEPAFVASAEERENLDSRYSSQEIDAQ